MALKSMYLFISPKCIFILRYALLFSRIAPLFSRIALSFLRSVIMFLGIALLFYRKACLFSRSAFWISQKCPIVFHYIFYSNFGLHDSLENAISQHLKWLIIQRFSKVSALVPPGGLQCPLPKTLQLRELFLIFFSIATTLLCSSFYSFFMDLPFWDCERKS